MNIRIKELAEQAWDSLIDEMGDVVSEDGRLNWDFLHAYDQQFAELIVRECANRIDYWESRQGEHSNDLLKHFGVEE